VLGTQNDRPHLCRSGCLLAMRSLSRARWEGRAEEVAARVPRCSGGESPISLWRILDYRDYACLKRRQYSFVILYLTAKFMMIKDTFAPQVEQSIIATNLRILSCVSTRLLTCKIGCIIIEVRLCLSTLATRWLDQQVIPTMRATYVHNLIFQVPAMKTYRETP